MRVSVCEGELVRERESLRLCVGGGSFVVEKESEREKNVQKTLMGDRELKKMKELMKKRGQDDV